MKTPLSSFISLFISLSFLYTTSCSDENAENIKTQTTAIEDVIAKLETAYRSDKIITDINHSSSSDNSGYILSFSDGSSIIFKYSDTGDDEGSVFVKIDNDGMWSISYDSGKNYSDLLDENGNPIKATGKDGAETSIQITVNDDGYYIINVFYTDNPLEIISTVTTPYTSNSSCVLESVVRNDISEVITITLTNGNVYEFKLDVNHPTSVTVLSTSLNLSAGSEANVKFRINPSNAFFNFITSGKNSNIHLDLVEQLDRRSSINESAAYRIASVERDTDTDGNILPGQYIATIIQTGAATDPHANIRIVIETKNDKGEEIQLASQPFELIHGAGTDITEILIGSTKAELSGNTFLLKVPYNYDIRMLDAKLTTNCAAVSVNGSEPIFSSMLSVDLSNPVTITAISSYGEARDYRLVAHFSNLPMVFITTPQGITSKDEWVKKCTITIENAGSFSTELTDVQMKGRGNTSWDHPKKPYAIKLHDKTGILGMPKHKRWCLIANWADRTLIRNAVAFEIAKQFDGLDWTPRGQFVEVMMNGHFLGNYYLCEQIKVDSNRINIAEMEATDKDTYSITGGYLVELDTYFDETNKFITDLYKLPVNIKDPDEDVLQPEQMLYITDYFNNIERLLAEGSSYDDICSMIDPDSFIDWWLVHELTVNSEPMHPKSSYMHKNRNDVLKAGPVWDFDWRTFIPEKAATRWVAKDAIWYSALFKYPEFIARVKERWASHKPALEAIPLFITSTTLTISESARANSQLWTIGQDFNLDENMSWEEACETLTKAYSLRLEWLDRQISAL